LCHKDSHQRQRESKDRSLARRALDPDATALRFYQALRDGQAETRAACQSLLTVAS
jgi:hypothetical protein